MKKMFITLAVLLLSLMCGYTAFAEAEFDYGKAALEQAVPPEAAEILEEQGIDPDGGGADSLSLGGVLSYIWSLLAQQAAAPLKLLVSLCGTVLLCAISASISDSSHDKTSGIFTTVGVLAGAGMSIAAISEILRGTLELLSAASVFITAFIPIFAGIISVMGHTATASVLNTVTLAATQLFSQLAVNFLAPLCGAVMGLSITGAIHPQLNAARLGDLIKKIVMWTLSLLMTVFMSILSLQTFTAASADSVLIRTAKFAVSSGVPIVGGTISDAVGTVYGSLGIIKSSVGTYGIIAAAVIILPTLIRVVCYRLAVTAAEAVSDLFGINELTALLKSCGAVMSIIIAVIVCFLLLNTIAAVIMLSISAGTA